MYSNCGLLVLEVTAVPTEPQPLPISQEIWVGCLIVA